MLTHKDLAHGGMFVVWAGARLASSKKLVRTVTVEGPTCKFSFSQDDTFLLLAAAGVAVTKLVTKFVTIF